MREDTSLHVMIPSSILCSAETEVLQEKASREIRFLRVSRLHYIRNAPYTIYMYTVFYQPPVPVTVCMHGPPDGLVHHGSSVSAVVLGSLATTWLVYTLAKIPVCIIYSCLCRPDAWAWLECHALTLEDWRYWTHVHCPHTHTNTEAAPLFITLSPESYCSHTDAESENSIYTSNRAPLMTKIWGQFPKNISILFTPNDTPVTLSLSFFYVGELHHLRTQVLMPTSWPQQLHRQAGDVWTHRSIHHSHSSRGEYCSHWNRYWYQYRYLEFEPFCFTLLSVITMK